MKGPSLLSVSTRSASVVVGSDSSADRPGKCGNPAARRLRTIGVEHTAAVDGTVGMDLSPRVRVHRGHPWCRRSGFLLAESAVRRRRCPVVARGASSHGPTVLRLSSDANMVVLESDRSTPAQRPRGAAEPGEEAALLIAVAGGDRDAFSLLYDLLISTVHSIVLAVVRDQAQSEEVTQEVMVDIWRLATRFDPERGSVRAWAATLAHRKAVDRVRSSQASRVREQAEADIRPDRTPVAEEPSEVVQAEEQRGLVVNAMAGLSEAQREAIELAYFGGHTYREVAEMLDTPEGTVKTRIRDGLTRLRKVMEVDHV